ncbi:MAG TPA: maleylpyruvate isomerase family mycothiol-dependent enzyme [Acidothermaceae bacterium]|jgi:maleylpyruvate isomerase
MAEHFDPSPTSAEIDSATARLLDTVRSMADDDVSGPSLLPGWTRGHVLTHIARNADGLCNLLLGAAEGVERSAYPSREARVADIESGARRPIKEHIADIEATAARFGEVVAATPPSAWGFVLAWGSAGQQRPASEVVNARLREVAIHHLDLDAGYRADRWPPDFAVRILRSALPAFEVRGLAACTLIATDADATVAANGGSDVEVRGPAHALATWLLGRDSGGSLQVSGGALPTPPEWK